MMGEGDVLDGMDREGSSEEVTRMRETLGEEQTLMRWMTRAHARG